VNSTISGNRVNNTISFGPYDGGGILATGPLTLVHSTVTDNHAGPIIGASSSRGGGIRASGLTTIENSIIAGNTAATEGDDLWLTGTIIASGANLIGDNSGAEATFPAGPLAGTKAAPLNPQLSLLGDYGGPTPTMRPFASSPAIDGAIATADTPAVDQRGFARPGGALYDLGAVERQASDVDDTDADTVPDGIDNCPLDANTDQADFDGDLAGDACDDDDDNDGMGDTYETTNGLDPLNSQDAFADPDGDGYTNLEEFKAGTDPQNAADFPAERKVPVAIFILLGADED
jgi:hypothetical protein